MSRFVVVGVWNTAVGWLLYVGFHRLGAQWDLHYLWALLPTHVVATAHSWWTQRTFVYADGDVAGGSFLRFSGVYVGALAVNALLLPLLVELTPLGPELAQAAVLLSIPVLTYVANYYVTFRVHQGTDP